MSVETSIIEKNVELMKIGNPAMLNIDAIDSELINGSIINISPEAATSSRMVTVEIAIPKKYMSRLMPGLSAQLSIIVYSTISLVIPKSALIEEQFVFVLDENSQAVKKEVEIKYQARDYVEVSKGLSEGDLVVMTPSRYGVKEGIKVIYNEPIQYKE